MSAHGESDAADEKIVGEKIASLAEDEKIASLATDETKPRDDDEAEHRKTKAQVILDACQRRDLDALRDLAISDGGFLSDSLRQRAYDPSFEKTESWDSLPRHRDEDQVRLDVDRSFIYYPNDTSRADLDGKKTELSDLITETLRRYPYLCYFQGYHDICQVLLLVLPPPVRSVAVARLSALRIRDFMLPNLAPAVAQLRLIPDILLAVDPPLCRHLSQTEPFFALSGTLTMYAHDIQSYGDIARLFDALLAREQVFSVYVFAQIVLNRREELFDTPADEPEMLHSILSKLPQPLHLEALIADAAGLFARHPPETLRSWSGITRSSVLKTARDMKISAAQSMEDGHRFFENQIEELQWAEQKQRIARKLRSYVAATATPVARGVVLAVLVGVAAVYLRKASPGAWASLTAFWSG